MPNGSRFDAIRSYAPLLRPGDRFSHTTAAELWDLPLGNSSPALHVTALAPKNAPRSRGVRGHRTSDPTLDLRHGLPVSAPGALFLELATMLPLAELVVIGDALILRPAVLDPADIRPYSTPDELWVAARSKERRPGSVRARRALELVRQGAESRPETLLRLLLVDAGLPEPEVNIEIRDEHGRFIARADLVYPERRVIVEYDGDQHRASTTQYERDMERVERLIAAGWRVIRVRSRGLFVTPEVTVARVRDALDA